MQVKQPPRSSFSAPGGRALMSIFAVLCLTVFTILTLSTVLANHRLSTASFTATSAYYRADMEAETKVALLRTGVISTDVTKEADGIFSFSVPISDTQALCVRVRIQPGGSTQSPADYEILSWQQGPIAEWEADETVSVWSGN